MSILSLGERTVRWGRRLCPRQITGELPAARTLTWRHLATQSSGAISAHPVISNTGRVTFKAFEQAGYVLPEAGVKRGRRAGRRRRKSSSLAFLSEGLGCSYQIGILGSSIRPSFVFNSCCYHAADEVAGWIVRPASRMPIRSWRGCWGIRNLSGRSRKHCRPHTRMPLAVRSPPRRYTSKR